MRHAGGNAGRARLRPERWLFIEWSLDEVESTRYFPSTPPADTQVGVWVHTANWRWRAERDYDDLKHECGLGHYEGGLAGFITTPA